MNTYDFDKTVFYPDSSAEFVKFIFKSYPAAIWRTIPKTLVYSVQYCMKRLDTKSLKEQVFSFLPFIEDVDSAVKEFWRLKEGNIQGWYLKQKRTDDVIISASPEFLLRPICEKLGVRLIGTVMDKRTGKISGKNCHDREKPLRFEKDYPGEHTEEFYSDSLSDTPMAMIADRAYLVKKEKISDWPK